MGTQLPLPKTGTKPPTFGQCLLWPNGWMDQDATWYGDRPRPRPRCARWQPSSPSLKRGHRWRIFGQCLLWPNGWMDQDATWYEGRPRPGPHCVTWRPSSAPSQKGQARQFSADVYCGQTVAHLSYCRARFLTQCIDVVWGSQMSLKVIGNRSLETAPIDKVESG